jgi:hypothetical protein
MPNLDSVEAAFLYAVGATVLVILWAVAVYRTEVRRSGANVWTEQYNDRVIPLYRTRPVRRELVPTVETPKKEHLPSDGHPRAA